MRLKRAERRFRLSSNDYAQLAAFRHTLRGFLRFGETAAAEVGLTSQHYQAMLVLRACPEEQRITFELFAFHGKSYDEIAAKLKIAKNTVGTRIMRARSKLRELFTAERGDG